MELILEDEFVEVFETKRLDPHRVSIFIQTKDSLGRVILNENDSLYVKRFKFLEYHVFQVCCLSSGKVFNIRINENNIHADKYVSEIDKLLRD